MQIHELNRPRRTDEGPGWDTFKSAIGTSVSNAVADATGQDRQANAASAGILDPKKKLAAVMQEPAMVKLATDYAKEWLATQPKPVPEAIAERVSVPSNIATKPTTVPAQGFNADNLMNLPGMQKYAAPATGTQPQPGTSGSRINKADPNNPNIKDQNRYVQGRAGSGTGGNATKFAKYDPATSATANAGQGINNMVRGGVAAQQPAAPAPATGTAMPLKPFQVPGAGTNPNPANAVGYKPAAAAADKTAVPPSDPAKAKYLKDFLEFANKKIAMRDPTTYKMIGLTSLYTADKNYSLKTELDAAKKEVIKAQGDPAATELAVKNYILTAMAGAQLMASGNKVAAATPQTPVLGRQAPAAGKTGAAATATPPTSATGQITGSNAVALLNQTGLTAQLLGQAGQDIQTKTSNKQLSTTGDSVIDTMLESMGYTVS